MANITRSLADTAGFIPQSWANQALAVLRNQIVLAKNVARDSDFTDVGWKGKTLNIPYPGTFAASDKVTGSVATVATPSGGNSVNITLSKHKTVDYILEDVAFSQAQAGVSMMEAYGSAAGIAIAEAVESDLIATVQGWTLTTLGTIGTNLAAATVQGMQKALDDAKAPQNGRYFFVSTKDRNALLADSNLSNWYAFAQQQAIGQGVVPGIYGFDGTGFSQLLPNASGSGTPSNVQIVTISGGATGGTFTLTYGAQTTAAIPFPATPGSIAAAVQALSSVPAGGTVFCQANTPTGGTANTASLGPFNLVLFNWGVPTAFTGSATGLTGGTPALAVTNGSTAAQVNIAYQKNALMLATRPLASLSSAGVEIAYANDPQTGLGIRVQMQLKPEYRGLYVAYDILYGTAAIRPNQGILAFS
ncbi:MAG TPA: P22 phage major capsid protein family protein [Ktedonobacterales bacterium]|nr:P22 phage major capsid protein family protein [Ktedonobacterales bacterium]